MAKQMVFNDCDIVPVEDLSNSLGEPGSRWKLYGNASNGAFYGTCETNANVAAKISTIDGFMLDKGTICIIEFSDAVPASATLNVSSTGAKSIYYKGSAISENIIKENDTCTFVYDGTNYVLIGIDTGTSTTSWIPLSGV